MEATPSPEAPFLPPIFQVGISGNGTVDPTISSQGLNEFLTTLAVSVAIGFVLWVIFEIKRNKRSVYAPRPAKLPHRAPPPLPYGPLRWVWTVATLPGPETLRLAGMDAYCLLRFNYLCLRICLFATFWGMLVLTPIYVLEGSEQKGSIYYITLANVTSDSNAMWVTVVFAYLFTWHALYVLRGEHQAFAEMREEFLTTGDPDFAAQTRYTTKVENVPAELRSAVALEAYFDDLFPGQVHSAVMCLNMPGLEAKVERREVVADKLEKTRSLELLAGRVIYHRHRRFPCDCCGARSGMTEAEFLAGDLARLNQEIEAEQKGFLQAAQKLNAMDDGLIQASIARHKGAAGGGGEQQRGEGVTESARGESLEAIDLFLKSKSEKESTWAMQEVEDVEDETAALAGRRPGPAENQRATPGDDPEAGREQPDSDLDTSGIEEEMAARRARRRSRSSGSDGGGGARGGSGGGGGGPSSLGPGPRPGAKPAVEADQPLAGGAAGLIGAAPVMAKEALSSLAYVGNTAFRTTRRVARGVLYLTLGQKMSTTGFVTFKQMSACAASRQVLVAPRPDWCDCEPAPDPRDVVWKNIAVPQPQNQLRHNVAALLVALGAVFWSVPVVLIQVWASYEQLELIFPFLVDLERDSILYYLIAGYLPVVLLLLLMLVLPFIFQALAYHYERRKSHSEVQRSILTRYFTYQVANIYVTVASGSIVSALQEIIDNPAAVLNILGETFPAVAVYFLDVIVVKIFVGLTFELLRGWPLIRVLWSQRCTNRAFATEREVRTGPFGPAELLYGWVYPTLLLVLIVCFVYAVISPFIMPAGALFFGLAYLVYKYQALYVYVPKYESGGVFWFSVYPRVLIGLALAQLTLAGYIYVQSAITQATLILPLPALIYWYGYRSYERYLGPAERISMETAARTDRRDASAMAAAVKAVAEGRRGRHWEGSGPHPEEGGGGGGGGREEKGVNPDDFEPLLYAQLALTSPSVEPSDCSPRDSAVEASQQLRRRRQRQQRRVPEDEMVSPEYTGLRRAHDDPDAATALQRDGGEAMASGGTASSSGAAPGEAGSTSAADEARERVEARRSSWGAAVGVKEAVKIGAAALEAGESAAVAAAGPPPVVSAEVAAVAAAWAAGDRDANYRFEDAAAAADGLAVGGSSGRSEGRSLTRREQEALKRRALVERSLVSVNSWTRRSGD